MRIGIVCPYSFDAHGGVQVHVMDLAGELFRRGHEVQVLAPASQDTELPDWVTSAGDSIAIPYNGSVARLNFGALVARRARRWLEAGDFDILHIHEPITPSVGMLTLQAATGPVVGTFHAAMDRSLARELLSPATVPLIEKLSARIAVSEEARRTLIQYHGGDAVVIPNGVNVAPFAGAPKDDPRFQGTEDAPTISFLGRLDEPRKGLRVLADAIPTVLESVPGARFLIAGRGQAQEIRDELARFGDSVVFLGESVTRTRPLCWPRPPATWLRRPVGSPSGSSWSRPWPQAPGSSPPTSRPSPTYSPKDATGRCSATRTAATWPESSLTPCGTPRGSGPSEGGLPGRGTLRLGNGHR